MVTISVSSGATGKMKETSSNEFNHFIELADKLGVEKAVLRAPVLIKSQKGKTYLFNGVYSTDSRGMYVINVDSNKLNALLSSYGRDIEAGYITYNEIMRSIEHDIKEFVTVERVKNE